MQQTGQDHSTKSNSTALVLLNTRNIAGYKSVDEMVNPDPNTKWGNQFGFIHVSIPELIRGDDESSIDPIKFVFEAHEIIKRKKNSAAVFLTGKLLDTSRKYIGPEVCACFRHPYSKLIHGKHRKVIRKSKLLCTMKKLKKKVKRVNFLCTLKDVSRKMN